MAQLLRKINVDAWAKARDYRPWGIDMCPAEVVGEVFDRKGLSMWRVDGPEQVERAVVVQAMLRSTIGEFSYILLDQTILKQEGLKIKDKPMKAIDEEIGDLHVEVVELTGKQLIRLAHIIDGAGDPVTLSRPVVLAAVKHWFAAGKLDRDFLFNKGKHRSEDEVNNSKSLLSNLWKLREIDFLP